MKVIKKIKVLSIAKIFAIVTGGLYLAVVLVVIVFGSVIVGDSSMISSVRGFGRFDFLGLGTNIIATFLFALIIAAINFFIGAIIAWLYNATAALVGGIEIELEEAGSRYTMFEKSRNNQVKNKKEPADITSRTQSADGADQPVKHEVSATGESDTYSAYEK